MWWMEKCERELLLACSSLCGAILTESYEQAVKNHQKESAIVLKEHLERMMDLERKVAVLNED